MYFAALKKLLLTLFPPPKKSKSFRAETTNLCRFAELNTFN